MEIIFIIIPLSVTLVFLIGVVFWWFLKSGQFEDLEGPAYRVVMDDDLPPETPADKAALSGEMTENRNQTNV